MTLYPLVEHATALLYHVSKHRMERTTLVALSEETGIPRSSLEWLLDDAETRKGQSIIGMVASDCGFAYKVFRGWRGGKGRAGVKRHIIDVEHLSEYNRSSRL